MNSLLKDAEIFLKELIATPSFSKEEEQTALIIEKWLKKYGVEFSRKHNNIWAKNKYFDASLHTILLNSHHDTVKPSEFYTLDPFSAIDKDGKIYGLGSNDAGASLVGLWTAFIYFYDKKLKYNLIFSATAEEEISGKNGVESILGELGDIAFAIVGEPTSMNLAIAEKGLVVLDCEVTGKASHVAHYSNENSIYNALEDILKVKEYRFDRVSEVLGETKAVVTIINGGDAHNVVPDKTRFTIDVRTNELYSNQEIVDIFQKLLKAKVTPRSLRLNSSKIEQNHPFVLAAVEEGCFCYGSPTLSDQALLPFDSVKIGIGDSLRSHTADEYIYKEEFYNGIEKYIKILSRILN